MTGDQQDMFQRLRALLPTTWFPGVALILDALLNGVAYAMSFAHSLWAYAKLQTRIVTATDGWLDMIAWDFFGTSLLRAPGQSDDSFRIRIVINLLRGKGTRPAMVQVLKDVTGQVPVIFEPNRPMDIGALNSPTSAGYCGVARMGSMAVPYTAMITAFRPVAAGGSAGAAYCRAPSRSALNTPLASSYTNSSSYTRASATDADIYAAVDAVKPVGTVMWVAIR
ncbi:hypothetical protein [Pandoraea sp. SD6-2]|uniref:hypothetical protein n=1 Tax=Pandoraea sp. SD6-2 TaxID=1286093 RepID=UPI00032D6C7E|nr:hypothetical protein [Pandoraea sp. SD6-2]EON13164.1 hypothetical protein C266_14169 [Pandoraea sp. SD6-2]